MGIIADKFTKGERRAIDEAARVARFDWNLCTGRAVKLSDVMRLVDRGVMEDGGMVLLCDGDGHALQPERHRQSWRLTDQGRLFSAALDAEENAENRRRFPLEVF